MSRGDSSPEPEQQDDTQGATTDQYSSADEEYLSTDQYEFLTWLSTEQLESLRGLLGNRLRKRRERIFTQLEDLNDKRRDFTVQGKQHVRRRLRRIVTGDEKITVRDHMERTVQRMQERANEPMVVRTKDRLWFTIGVLLIPFTQWTVTARPEYFSWLYGSTMIPLLLWRVYAFYVKKYHYFLFDFCYFCNVLCLLFCYLMQSNTILFHITFCLSNGPLLFANVVWRSSFVFHCTERVTTTLVHVFPPLLTYAIRWHPQHYMLVPMHVDQSISYLHSYSMSVLTYLAWQMAYIICTEFLCAWDLQKDPNLQTSLRWITRDRRGTLYGVCHSVMCKLQLMSPTEPFDENNLKTKLVFWSTQLMYTLLTLMPVKLAYDNHLFHVALLVMMVVVCIWNGAGYYIEVFSRNYNKQFQMPAPPT